MDANQRRSANPFGMDEACTNCDLCESRTRVVHGYGDVDADFVFVGERPGSGADETGVPFTGDQTGVRLQSVLGRLGFSVSDPENRAPELRNVYLTYLTRCRNPQRPPTDEEIDVCEPYLNAEIRTINPEVIVPIGQRSLCALSEEYTTSRPGAFDVERDHATTIRGRGFELVPMRELDRASDAELAAFVEHLAELMERDYRQTKGRQGRSDGA